MKLITIPFANAGDKTPIGDVINPDGTVSYPAGWGALYDAPAGSGNNGLNLSRTNFNYLFNEIYINLQDLQQNGIAEFIEGQSYNPGAFILSNTIIYSNISETALTVAPPSAGWIVRDFEKLSVINGFGNTSEDIASSINNATNLNKRLSENTSKINNQEEAISNNELSIKNNELDISHVFTRVGALNLYVGNLNDLNTSPNVGNYNYNITNISILNNYPEFAGKPSNGTILIYSQNGENNTLTNTKIDINQLIISGNGEMWVRSGVVSGDSYVWSDWHMFSGGLGIKKWNNLSTNRAPYTTYTNAHGYDINVYISTTSGGSSTFFVNELGMHCPTTTKGDNITFSIIVPANSTYEYQIGGDTFNAWYEYY